VQPYLPDPPMQGGPDSPLEGRFHLEAPTRSGLLCVGELSPEQTALPNNRATCREGSTAFQSLKPLAASSDRGLFLCLLCLGRDIGGIGKAHHVALVMTNRDFDSRSGSRNYGRWSFPWRSEDDWGPITAAVVLLILLSVLIYSGLTAANYGCPACGKLNLTPQNPLG
jgi:hypothetical protein